MGQRCLALPCSPLTLPRAPCCLLQSSLAEGTPGLPQHRLLKGLLKTSSEGKCIPLPMLTLRWHWHGLGQGEQALNVSALFIARYVSCCISSGRQLPVGKYFCAFLGVPPPPTGKDLCKTLPSRTGEAVRPSGACVCGKSSERCVQRASACAGSSIRGKVSGCLEDKAQFYFLVASAWGEEMGLA